MRWTLFKLCWVRLSPAWKCEIVNTCITLKLSEMLDLQTSEMTDNRWLIGYEEASSTGTLISSNFQLLETPHNNQMVKRVKHHHHLDCTIYQEHRALWLHHKTKRNKEYTAYYISNQNSMTNYLLRDKTLFKQHGGMESQSSDLKLQCIKSSVTREGDSTSWQPMHYKCMIKWTGLFQFFFQILLPHYYYHY